MTTKNNRVPQGSNLIPGLWYRIARLDPHDPNPSMTRGAIVQCASEKADCIDPENHASDGMGAQWFADYGLNDDGEFAYKTLIIGVELVEQPS